MVGDQGKCNRSPEVGITCLRHGTVLTEINREADEQWRVDTSWLPHPVFKLSWTVKKQPRETEDSLLWLETSNPQTQSLWELTEEVSLVCDPTTPGDTRLRTTEMSHRWNKEFSDQSPRVTIQGRVQPWVAWFSGALIPVLGEPVALDPWWLRFTDLIRVPILHGSPKSKPTSYTSEFFQFGVGTHC